MEGAYLNRYVTDEQRSRRPIFIATLWAGASWLFFRVARSTRMTKIWALLRQSGSDRLEKQPTDLRQNTSYFGDRTLAIPPRLSAPSDIGTRLIGLVVTVGGGCFCFSQNRRYLFVRQRFEVSRHLESLLQDFHRVAARDAYAQRQVHAKFQALDRRYGFTL